MALKYILKSLNRRKIRTILMLLSLLVGVTALVALNATVDSYKRFYVSTISNTAGDYDLVITKKATEPELLINENEVIAHIGKEVSDNNIKQIVARIQGVADLDVVSADGQAQDKLAHGSTKLVALRYEADNIGQLQIISGTLNFAPGYAVILQETADTFDLKPGDSFELGYALPVPRRKGVRSASNVSTRKAKITLTVSAIALQWGVTGEEKNDAVLVDLDYVQEWLGLPTMVERIVVVFDESTYTNNDPQASAFNARMSAEKIQNILGEIYDYSLPRAKILSDTFEAFIFFQALVSIYGILSLSVVGLLVRTMVMTNVREQTRDLALFRILGAQQSYLFNLVVIEVGILGIIGVGLGAVIGQSLTNFVIVPLIAEQANVPITDMPTVSFNALLLSILTAAIVLLVSSYAPAKRAASTKIMYAINPGVAEGIGLDDLAKLRERRVDYRIFWSGLIVLFYPVLIFFAFPLAFNFGVLWLQATLIFGSLLLLIIGASLFFFPVTLPMERLLIGLIGLVAVKVGYFSKRNIIRGQNRNTLISLMIVISATLPTFFATTLAIEIANTPTDTRLRNGTPIIIRKYGSVLVSQSGTTPVELKNRFTNTILQEIKASGTIGPNVAVTHKFNTSIKDSVGLRNVGINIYGLNGNLAKISYPESIKWIDGNQASFDELLADPNTIIISQGLSDFFELGVGNNIILSGQGLDHTRTVRIVGVLGRFPGFNGFTSKRTRAERGDTTLFMNETSFRELTRDPLQGPYDPTYPIFERLLAAPNLRAALLGLPEEAGNTAVRQTVSELRKQFGLTENLTVRSTPEDIKSAEAAAGQIQVIILIMTSISFILAIFGVFVVTYMSVYTRRTEIAMLKAIGDSNMHLFGMFLSEAMVTTISATLTGIVTGIILSYVFRYSTSFGRELTTVPAFDTVVTPYMLVMMIAAALLSTLFATWSYLRRKAIDIIRSI